MRKEGTEKGEKKEKKEKGENNGDEESSRRVRDLGWGRGKSKKAGTWVSSLVDSYFWKETK